MNSESINNKQANDNKVDSPLSSNGNACTAWVIETGNMDYLKANVGVCPNGTTLSWKNTSCK